MRSVCTFIGAILAAFTPLSFAQVCNSPCGTIVPPGPVSGAWNAAGSPYCIQGDISIGDLAVGPGVCILVDGPYSISVAVRLRMLGDAAAPIILTSKDPALRWKGLVFQDAGPGSELNWVAISRSDTSAVRVNNGAGPILRRCSIADNTRIGSGAGVEAVITSGDLAIEDCTFSNNRSTSHGGALRATLSTGSRLLLSRSVFEDNVANPDQDVGEIAGGAIYIKGDATILECHFLRNTSIGRCVSTFACDSYAQGGGAYFESGSSLIQGSLFLDNSTVSINHGSCFFGGVTYSLGSGFFLETGSLVVRATLFACNNSVTGGANCSPNPRGSAFLVYNGSCTVENCTIARNSHAGIYRQAGVVDCLNSILYFNNPTSPSTYGPQFTGQVSFAYSNVQGGLQNGQGNISVNPGFTCTWCTPQSFTLFSASPCVDSGEPAIQDACLPPGLNTPRSDMGAFAGTANCAWNLIPGCYADCDGSCGLTANDFVCFINRFTANDPYANCDRSVNSPTLTANDFVCFIAAFVSGCS